MDKRIPEIYGSLVFNDKIMREKLPKDMYKALKKTIENGTHLELDVANSVAVAMKEWALEHFFVTEKCDTRNPCKLTDFATVNSTNLCYFFCAIRKCPD